jgi:serine/threonine protein kinase
MTREKGSMSATMIGSVPIIGRTLGNFEITSQLISKGGMGEVYQAKDRELGHNVSIKVLAEEITEENRRTSPRRIP